MADKGTPCTIARLRGCAVARLRVSALNKRHHMFEVRSSAAPCTSTEAGVFVKYFFENNFGFKNQQHGIWQEAMQASAAADFLFRQRKNLIPD